ncbi:alpha/beta fold hydrolase [Lysinibacillus sp. KU-BSD001]|uniref:alpha/beta fold hydrolase n=1 Tax=Lysinibacillus sp. KU-BSD001 TaxID=3141328 RepID=UPI0036EB8038
MKYIFIHGLGQNSASWNQTISYLSEHRYINCPDLSTILNDKEVTYNNLYNSFVEYCEGMDEPLNLCGLSLGGILALNYAIDYPEKVGSLVLIGTQYVMPKLLLKLQNIIFRFMPKTSFEKIGFKKKDFFKLTDSMVDLNFSKNLIDISCVTLIVCGKKDRANRNASKGLVGRIPEAELRFIANAGHEVNIQAPRVLAETLEIFYGKHHL